METEKITSIFKSKKIERIAIICGIIAAVILIFWLGMGAGYRQAGFNFRYGDDYFRAFGPNAKSGMLMHSFGSDIAPVHGTSGTIVGITLPTFMVADDDNIERVVRIGDDTLIRQARATLAPENLAVGEEVIVIGAPGSSSEIEARLVRILPTGSIVPDSASGSTAL